MTASTYHKKRRALAKRAGICIECNSDNAEPGKTKCAGCRAARKAKSSYVPTEYPTQFSEAQVSDILKRTLNGQPQWQVARIYGCAQSTICRLVARENARRVAGWAAATL